ncbi:MAG TPA: prepilin-type N-terminal cleavage/methylation domain-containing protein [Phycisphaerae bacterium]|nr:prepilin-type N-terminal cleavage/methylation domain-containing protein [Phycisphaerae bacterium]HOJ73407.1 prepilin-type N-terminal cleavage/methylation domain-containing protein [Phycisphaerae bacterium]HOM51016.1 prepilin-type N-terminal cleavage/methylation domain-containing protein [Phycisphaerae bacterium]HON66731.1 prepilin-type N-terminal cleavage/methylation domain-containing protein [Phycisphaerae bacterium]HOQ87317.1 prepilin-type N-terminal cleavage/methylation domain-containing 
MTSRTNAVRSTSSRAFTLIEVLVVVAIIALLISILLPSLAAARARAKLVVCQTNLRTIAQASYQYCAANRDVLPSGPLTTPDGKISPGAGQPWEYIYPYVMKVAGRRTEADPSKATVDIPIFQCPDDQVKHTTSQRAIEIDGQPVQVLMNISYGVNTSVEWARRRQGTDPGEIRKLSSIKAPGSIVWYCDSGDDDFNGAGGWILYDCAARGINQCGHEVHHKNGNNFVFVDSHVEFKNIIWRQSEPGEHPVVQWGLPLFPGNWIPNSNGKYEQDGKIYTADTWRRPRPAAD